MSWFLMMRRAFITALVACAVLIAPVAVAPGAAAEAVPEQWRSYWVDSFNPGVYTPEQVTELVDDAVAANANALIVQTTRGYDCLCNRAVYPRSEAAIAPEPYDPLADVIEQARAAGLEVHAWVNVNTMWGSRTPPLDPDHVYNQHGPTAEGGDRWLSKRNDGEELIGSSAFIDPGHPDARDYIVNAITSIVREYDVDGINLDYIRYPDYNSTGHHSDWGYNDTSVARFQAAAGRSDLPPADDPEWSAWRRDQITSLVRRIYLSLWEADPQARLSVNAITYGESPQHLGGFERTAAHAVVLQDWKGWLGEGITDTAITMNYKRAEQRPQDRMFAEWSEFLADNQGERQTVNGPGLYLNPVDDNFDQALIATSPTPAGNVAAGWSGYSYANPSGESVDGSQEDRDAERAALTELLTGPDGPFAEPAAVPEMPWKTSPDDGHVAGYARLNDGTPLDNAAVTLRALTGDGEDVKQTVDGSGWFGFVHVPPGAYVVEVELPSRVLGQPLHFVRVNAGEIADGSHPSLARAPLAR